VLPYSVEGKLVVAILRARCSTSRTRPHFERDGEDAYIALQFSHAWTWPRARSLSAGEKLLAFIRRRTQRVEVVILSKNDRWSGCGCSARPERAGLRLGARRVHARSQPVSLLDALEGPNLFLSANENDVMSALDSKVPAARVYPESAQARAPLGRVRIAFDGDAVLFPTRRSAYIRKTASMRLRAMRRRMRSSRCRRPVQAAASKPCSACSGRRHRRADASAHRVW